jgi:predicted RNase H-like HicB family nuclease
MRNYAVIYEKGDEGWGAYSPDLPGVYALGESREQVESRMREAIPAYLEFLQECDLPLPRPDDSVLVTTVHQQSPR